MLVMISTNNVALLFSATLMHDLSPEMLCTCTIIPIPVGCNVNVTDSANFRGIALLSSIFVILYCKNIMITFFYI